MKSICVVIPLYNEKDSLPALYEELNAVLSQLHVKAEIVFVDDGSVDDSPRVLRELQQQDSRIRIIQFRRNFGKSAALSAGFKMATGEVVVTMDADLQDQPSEMHKLLEKLQAGADLVSGWKRTRRDPLPRRVASKIFNSVTAWLTGVPLHDINCGFKAYRREVIKEIRVYGEMHRYIPVLASYRGFRVAEVEVAHRARRYGVSRYGLSRFPGGFFDLLTVIMLTRYNSKPLHAFGILGGAFLTAGLAIEIYLTVGWLFGNWIQDRPALMLGMLLLIVGVQFIFFGLLAEMIAYSSRREDHYSLRESFEPAPANGEKEYSPSSPLQK